MLLTLTAAAVALHATALAATPPASAPVPVQGPATVVEDTWSGPRNDVSLDLLRPALGALTGGIAVQAEVERAFWRHVSLFADVTVAPSNRVVAEVHVDMVGLSLGARFFPGGHAPDGFFLGGSAGAQVAWTRLLLTGQPVVAVAEMLDAQLGYTWLLWRHVTLSLGGGAAFQSSYGRTFGATESGSSGFIPSLRLAVGYAF